MLVLLRDTARRKHGQWRHPAQDSPREHLLPYHRIIGAGAPRRNPYRRTTLAQTRPILTVNFNPAITTPTKLMRAGVTPQKITMSTRGSGPLPFTQTLLRTPGTRADFGRMTGYAEVIPTNSISIYHYLSGFADQSARNQREPTGRTQTIHWNMGNSSAHRLGDRKLLRLDMQSDVSSAFSKRATGKNDV